MRLYDTLTLTPIGYKGARRGREIKSMSAASTNPATPHGDLPIAKRHYTKPDLTKYATIISHKPTSVKCAASSATE